MYSYAKYSPDNLYYLKNNTLLVPVENRHSVTG